MRVDVVLAFPDRVEHVRLDLAAGSTVGDALAAAGFSSPVEAVGIFGRRVKLDHTLADGDRVEIYRPLAMDPKEARRLRARTQGQKNRGRS